MNLRINISDNLTLRVGAPASGYYKEAAQEVSGPEALSASSNEAVRLKDERVWRYWVFRLR